MGRYSTFIEQEIKVLDKKSLLEAIQDLEHNDLVTPNGKIEFINWDGHKIEGYWYDETKNTLKAVAPFIEGYVEFTFEGGYNFRLVFEDKKVYFQKQPNIDWSTISRQRFL